MGATKGQELGSNRDDDTANSGANSAFNAINHQNAVSSECGDQSKRKPSSDSCGVMSAAAVLSTSVECGLNHTHNHSIGSQNSVACCKPPASSGKDNSKFGDGLQSANVGLITGTNMDLISDETGKLPSLTGDIGIAKDCMPPNNNNIATVKGDIQPPTMMSLPPSSTAASHETSSSLNTTANAHKSHLNSNNRNAMHNKGSMSMESQYMQQQNQVFVFSTQLANCAADAIMSGQFPSIIAFHCSQPATKSILEKHPLNEQQFKQGPGSWLNNFAQLKQGAKGMKTNVNSGMSPVLNTQYPPFRGSLNRAPCVRPCSHGPGGCAGPGMGPANNSCTNWPPQSEMCSDVGWQMHPNFVNSNSPNMPPNMRHPNSMAATRGCNPGNNSVMPPAVGQNSFSNNQMCFPHSNCGMQMPSSMPTGTKVPDENLTPQQRQHREEQLARLRELEMMINGGSELMNNPQPNMPHGNMRMPTPSQQMGGDPCGQGMLESCPSNSCMISEGEHSSDPSTSNMNNPSSVMVSNCGMGSCPPNHSNMPPHNAQMEWHKLQHQYYEENRRRKCPPQLSGSSHPSPMSQASSLNSPNPSIAPSPGKRLAGPPPPYRQGPRPLSSPHPSSPAATSSLSLPSPQIQSPADSRQFSSSNSCRLPPYASPGPPTPLADSSNVPLNSPKPGANTSLPSSTSGGASNTPISRTPSTGCTTTPSTATSSNSSPSLKKVSNLQANSLNTENAKSDSNSSGIMSENKPSLHSLNCNSPEVCSVKNEPQLYPVPSPQQIQYLNTFDGQELTIQKQPNTSLRETDLISPPELNFNNEFTSSQFPQQGMENGNRFMSPVENNVNHRFPNMSMTPNMCGPHYDMPPNQRFMTPENSVQRFNNPSFEHNRMPNAMDSNQPIRGPNMNCPQFSGSRMDGSRFSNPQDNFVNNRMRGPNPMDVGMPRFSSHMNENMQQSQYNPQMMHQMMTDQNQFNGPPHGNCLNQASNEGISSTHLQNLQKMTPPFDIGPTNKMDNLMNNNGQMIPSHPNGPPMAPPGPQQQMSQFDPIASMAAMSEQSPANPNMMPSATMNMTSMQVAASNSGPQSGGMVNFHTSMSSSMAHQNIGSNNNPNSGGMHYGMSSQMSHNMVGGPQTVNNTYVNATMSIQQLNIQNVTSPNYNSNVPPMQPCMNNPSGINPMSGPPLTGNMQMMSHNSVSPKLGLNASPVMNPRMSSNNPQHPFQQHQMQRGMSPMNYSGNANMGQRVPGAPYNSPNIQVKASAPNTIQYLPNRPINSGQQPASRPPNLDFLHRFTSPLTNLDNKVPTHNLQYFPNCSNMNTSQPTPPPNSNVPMSVGPGRPPMIRGSGSGAMMNTGGPAPCPSGAPTHGMMGEMFNRQPNPNTGPPPHNQMVPNSYPGMKPGVRGPGSVSPLDMPPDASQPLPPSVGHSYNYKQTPFYGNPAADPNYAVQFHNFQQQLYATNTRGNNSTNNNGGQIPPNSNMPSSNFFGAPK
ncbi:Protein BCL9-like protein [Dinothrombium tinctorium]|uniref:Protein BCL9-like protein n=1 Tax=Dinothrombium tinctorium TaxID=1965070 RepID=A0A443RKN5_9ACAR|nr:Protein BCL9-like protein [Dinothrombium tinctorium]